MALRLALEQPPDITAAAADLPTTSIPKRTWARRRGLLISRLNRPPTRCSGGILDRHGGTNLRHQLPRSEQVCKEGRAGTGAGGRSRWDAARTVRRGSRSARAGHFNNGQNLVSTMATAGCIAN